MLHGSFLPVELQRQEVKKDYENNVKGSLDDLANDLTSTGSSITSLLGQ